MSENQNNETLCDFIREIRSQADEIAKHLGDQHTFVEQKKQLADRLDQIRMRMEIEQAKLRGNSAAMREALQKAAESAVEIMERVRHKDGLAFNTANYIASIAKDALAAIPQESR